MSGDNDDFDAMMAGQEDSDPGPERIARLWDAVEIAWPKLHKDEGILTRGLMVVEVMDNDGTRDLRFLASPEMTPWDLSGMLRHANQMVEMEDFLDVLLQVHELTEVTDDDDDDE